MKKETVDWERYKGGRAAFIARVRERGEAAWRDLPWRNIDDPYAVLVSEIMLQQTQVSRVERYWSRFLQTFPTLDALAAADVPDVLELWQGLGYNRRALGLKRTADLCAAERAGRLPSTYEELVELPGIGPATAAGVMAFAHNEPAVYLETNVRSVFLYELFPFEEKVSDVQITPYVADTCPAATDEFGPRAWYYALLDYGAQLKASGVNPSRRSKSYARQSSFEGSHRQKRSIVLKCVLAAEDGITLDELACRLDAAEREAGREAPGVQSCTMLAEELANEGFFRIEKGRCLSR